MKKLFLLTLAILLILSMFSVSAYMPVTHKYIQLESLNENINSEMYKVCSEHSSTCYAGNVLTDVSVIYYYLEGTKYAFTHAPNFCRAMIESASNDVELSCAIGTCMHQSSDLNSHNILVPFSIRNSKLTNYLIHMFAEQKVDNYIQSQYPGTKSQALLDLNDYEQCLPIFKKVILGSEEYSDIDEQKLDNIFSKFILEIQTSHTGYDGGFKTKSALVNIKALPFWFIGVYMLLMFYPILVSVLLLLKIIKRQTSKRHIIALLIFLLLSSLLIYIFVMNLQGRGFEAIVNIIKPVSNIVPIGNSEQSYVDNAVLNSRKLLSIGPAFLLNSEPTGFAKLEEANRSVVWFDYSILFVLFIITYVYLRYLFKKNRVIE